MKQTRFLCLLLALLFLAATPPPQAPRRGKGFALSVAAEGYQHWGKLRHPIGEVEKIAAEREITAWNDAKNRNTCDAFKIFLRDYPQSAYRPLAEEKEKQRCRAAAAEQMVLVRSGTFEMGDVLGDGDDWERPVHPVTVGSFYLGKTEVTFIEYDAFCVATGRSKPADAGWGRGKRPVINVSWYDALAYCNWLSEQQGLTMVYTISERSVTADWNADGYRLPTEAEWEYAARSGGKRVRFGNGKDVADPSEINFAGSAAYKTDYSRAGVFREKTIQVGSFRPNDLGLHDMTGNVWEWCWDWFGEDYYAKSEQDNPRGPGSGSRRVLRGGSWGNPPGNVRVAYRNGRDPSTGDFDYGFRLAKAARGE